MAYSSTCATILLAHSLVKMALADGTTTSNNGGTSSNNSLTIIITASVIGTLVIFVFAVLYWRHKTGRASQPVLPTRVVGARSNRLRRDASVRTVPEYTQEPKDEEMVLEKAETSVIERAASESSSARHVDGTLSTEGPFEVSINVTDESETPVASIIVPGRPRAGTGLSHMTLRDIEPAPELRIERYDSVASGQSSRAPTPSIFAASYNESTTHLTAPGTGSGEARYPGYGHIPAASLSTMSVNSTIEEGGGYDGIPLSRRESNGMYFDAPAYINRSRSRSIDVLRTPGADAQGDDSHTGSTMDHSRLSVDVGHGRRGSSSNLRTLFKRPSPLASSTSSSDGVRNSVIHKRQISAPLSDTLVHTSYTLPKAGINALQAAWLGSRDSINRITTFLSSAPPAFDAVDEEATLESESAPVAEAGTAIESGSPRRSIPAPLPIQVLTQLEQESAELSTLVHRASMRRSASSGIPPHLIALPPSLPGSPTTATAPVDWATELKRRSTSMTINPASSIVRIRRNASRSETMQSLNEMAALQPASPTPRRRAVSENIDNPLRSDSPEPLSPSTSLRAFPHTKSMRVKKDGRSSLSVSSSSPIGFKVDADDSGYAGMAAVHRHSASTGDIATHPPVNVE